MEFVNIYYFKFILCLSMRPFLVFRLYSLIYGIVVVMALALCIAVLSALNVLCYVWL